MIEKYRVVCSENQFLYPNQIFVDIAPESKRIHQQIVDERRLVNPDVKVILGSIYLRHNEDDNNISLEFPEYNKHSMSAKRYNEYMQAKLIPLIKNRFFEMKESQKSETLSYEPKPAKKEITSKKYPDNSLLWRQAKYRGD